MTNLIHVPARGTGAPPVARTSVLVPSLNTHLAADLVGRLGPLLGGHAAVVLAVVELGDQVTMPAATALATAYRVMLAGVATPADRPVRTSVRVAATVPEGIRRAADEEAADLILLPWDGRTGQRFGRVVGPLTANPPADLALVRLADGPPPRRFLLPLRGGPGAERALRLTARWASEVEGRLTVLHEVAGAPDEPLRALWRLAGELPVPVTFIHAGPLAERFAHLLPRYDAVVLGIGNQAAGPGELARQAIRAGKTVMLVKARDPFDPRRYSRQDPRPGSAGWFAERAFWYREFRALERLVEQRQATGTTVGVCLMVENGTTPSTHRIDAFVRELQQRHPLVDRVALLFSNRPAEAPPGVPVVSLAQLGLTPDSFGWLAAGLRSVPADLLAFISWEPTPPVRTAYGLLGPLLADPSLAWVSALPLGRSPAFAGRRSLLAAMHPTGPLESFPLAGLRETLLSLGPLAGGVVGMSPLPPAFDPDAAALAAILGNGGSPPLP
ncbi:MAG: hypothetical protein HY331_15355 [Chloroflexi bacterium]|nr:hypothetical protein [Chloroflexota bacterium]